MNFDVNEAVEILSRTPAALDAFLRNVSPQWSEFSYDIGQWSAFQVIGHLIHGERTDWIPRAELILSRTGDATFEPFDRFAQESESNGKSLEDLLDEFVRLRSMNIKKLLAWNLTSDDLQLEGIHPEFGKVTLAALLSTWVVHDMTHIRQISIGFARRYTDDVGPWKAYLSILK